MPDILIVKDANTLIPKLGVSDAERIQWMRNYAIYDINANGSRSGPFGPTVAAVDTKSPRKSPLISPQTGLLIDPATGEVVGGGADRRAKYFPNMLTGEAIQAAIDAAFAAGGGADVVLDYTTYTLTAPIQLREGVRLVGSGFVMTNYHDPEYVAGTRLLGNGTFNLVECSATDSATPMVANSGLAVNALMVMNTGCINMVLDNGAHGLKVGGVNTIGAGFSDFHDLLILRCTVYGALFENCARLNLHHITLYFNKHGFGYGTSSGGVWNWGNQRIDSIVGGNNTGRGFHAFARDGSELNNVVVTDIGFAGVGQQADSTATMTSGNININVPDLSKFEPGIAFLCMNSGSNFTANRTYFVLTRSGASGAGTITVALRPGGTAVVPSGVGPITFRTRGWQVMEMMGEGSTGLLTYCSFMSANDVEVGGAPRVVLGGFRGCLVQLGIFGGDAPNIAMRGVDSQSTVITQQGCTVDSDSRWNHLGSPVTHTWSPPGSALWTTGSGRGYLGLGEGGIECLGTAFSRLKVDRPFTGYESITNGQTLNGFNQVHLVYVTDTAGGAFTLQSGASDAMLGIDHSVFNATANAVTMNYNASSGAQIAGNGLAPANTYSIPAWTGVQIRLVKKGATFYWAVL